MAITTTQVGALQQDLILSIVQEHLVRSGKLLPTVRDYSALVETGSKSLEIPKLTSNITGPTELNADGVTPAAYENAAFNVDVLALDKWPAIAYFIPDRITAQTRVSMLTQYAELAGKKFGAYIDDQIIVELRQASASAPDHVIQVTGATNTIALADIVQARMLLNKANVPQENRFMLVSPEREAELLKIPDLTKANEYGARETLLDGEVGRLFGFRIMAHNGVAATEAIAYHQDAVGVAFQKALRFEEERIARRQGSDFVFSAGWGVQVLNDGKMQVLLENPV